MLQSLRCLRKIPITIRNMSTQSTEDDYEKNYFHSWYSQEDIACLRMGAPGADTLSKCSEIMKKASLHRLAKETSEGEGNLFQYGASSGDWFFRCHLATFLSEQYKVPVSRNNIFTTTGATGGLVMTLNLFFKKGDPVFLEDPTYFIAVNVLKEDFQMNAIPVTMEHDGIDINLLDEKLKAQIPPDFQPTVRYPFWALVYLIPAFQNPTGNLYSEDKMRRLVQIAKKYRVLLFCDDVYNMLYYSEEVGCPKPLLFYDNFEDNTTQGHVISNGSFSKILAPGLRLGWIQASTTILDTFKNSAIIASGGCLNGYTSGIMSSVLELGLETNHLAYLRAEYKIRMTSVCKILQKCLPKSCKFSIPEGGYFVWIELPPGPNNETDKILPWLEKDCNVTVSGGDSFSSDKNFKNFIRIAISFYSEEKLSDAVRRMCQSLTKYLA